MTELERRLVEDRELRDAALRLFKTDLALIRDDLKQRGVGSRIANRVGEATMDTLDDAIDYAETHRGTVAAVIAAVVLWFARGPIIDAVSGLFDDDEEPGEAGGRSDDD